MSIMAILAAASLTIGASGTERQVVVETNGDMGERTTNTEYGVFLHNTSGRLVKRGAGHVVFAQEIGWGTSGLATTVIVEEGTVSLVSGANWQLGPDTYVHGEKGMLRFYPVNSTIKPMADASGTITLADVLGGRATCLNVGRGESVDIGRLGAANRAALSLVKWEQINGDWIDLTDYYLWTTNETKIYAQAGVKGSRKSSKSNFIESSPSGKIVKISTIPGLEYAMIEHPTKTNGFTKTNIWTRATTSTLELGINLPAIGDNVLYYRIGVR